jgi:hypothetical protein
MPTAMRPVPAVLVALELADEARAVLPEKDTADCADLLAPGDRRHRALDPLAAQLGVGVHGQDQIVPADLRKDACERLIQRPGFLVGIADR